MKKFLLFIFAFSFYQSVMAQRHEIGIFAGGANVIGDVGKANYINPFPTKLTKDGKTFLPASIGALYRFNFNPQMGFRANASYSRVGAGDFKSGEQFKIDRNRNFANEILEGSIVFEYNFRDINDAQETSHSPYIFFGGGVYSAFQKTYDLNENGTDLTFDTKRKTNFTLPFGVGYKYRFNYNWIVSLETGFRYTNQDHLDYNVSEFSDKLLSAGAGDPYIQNKIDQRTFGDLNNKDWYVLTGFTLTYSFGRPACYCN